MTPAMRAARDKIRDEMPKQIDRFNEVRQQMPGLVGESQLITARIQVLQPLLEQREAELVQRAENNVEERHKLPMWKTGLRVLGSVLKVVPVYQPALGTVGTGLDFVSQVDPDDPLASLWEARDSLSDVDTDAFRNSAQSFQNALADVDGTDIANFKEHYKVLKTIYDQFQPAVDDIQKILKRTQAPKTEIDAELARLEAEDPIFSDLTAKVRELAAAQEEYAARLSAATQEITALATRIQENLLAVDAIQSDLQSALPKLSPRARSYLDFVERETKDRLLKYQYYVAKAFEYRMLRSYDEELNLNRVFDEFRAIVELGTGHDLGEDDFNRLKGIYLAELRRMAAEMFERMNAEAPERSQLVTIGLTSEELVALNNDERVTINLVDRGIFGATEENVRLVDLRTHAISVQPVGGSYGGTAFIRLRFEHSGLSRLASRGETFLFNHYRTASVNPITWKTVFDGIDSTLNETGLSGAAQSLLAHLLDLEGHAVDDLVLYSARRLG